MALNWNLKDCKDIEFVKTDWAVTDMLIWATMFVGFREITDKNYEEFYKRLHLQELVNGSFLTKNGKPKYLIIEDVKLRIGLTTSAGTFSRTEFMRRLSKNYFDK